MRWSMTKKMSDEAWMGILEPILVISLIAIVAALLKLL
jgi:hypothetical protein